MPREHDRVKMNGEELAAFLAGRNTLALGTLESDGGPWADASSCVFQDGSLFFRVPRASRSYANIQRDSRVCCVLERMPQSSYYETQAAIIHGRARPVADEATAGRVRAALEGLPDPVQPGIAQEWAFFSIGLEDVASFDFSKIKGRF